MHEGPRAWRLQAFALHVHTNTDQRMLLHAEYHTTGGNIATSGSDGGRAGMKALTIYVIDRVTWGLVLLLQRCRTIGTVKLCGHIPTRLM